MKKVILLVLFAAIVVASGYIIISQKDSSNVDPNTERVTIQDALYDGLSIEEALRVSPDSDNDGVKNLIDNCPFVKNPKQIDTNDDGIGDVCHVIYLAKEDLAKRLGGNAAVLGIGVAEYPVKEIMWLDTCLGLPSSELCAPGTTPGYKLILQVARESGQKYLYHTDKIETFRYVGPVNKSSSVEGSDNSNEIKEYVSCVCCCPEDNPPEKCLYHSKGEKIEDIIARDEAVNTDCSMFGCTRPTKYIYCD